MSKTPSEEPRKAGGVPIRTYFSRGASPGRSRGALVEDPSEGGEPRVGGLGGTGAARAVPVCPAGGTKAKTVFAAKPLHRDPEEELLPHHLPEIQPILLVVAHNHVPIRKIDFVFLFLLVPLVGEVKNF